MREHFQSLKCFFSHKKMQRESYGGKLKPNVKVTLSKPKENSLLANCGHLWCENGFIYQCQQDYYQK